MLETSETPNEAKGFLLLSGTPYRADNDINTTSSLNIVGIIPILVSLGFILCGNVYERLTLGLFSKLQFCCTTGCGMPHPLCTCINLQTKPYQQGNINSV